MNLYLLVEGQCTEKKVYCAWIEHVFPHLRQVQRIEDIKSNHFLILAGYGYPSYLQRIPTALVDIEGHGNIDHFLICVDAEEDTVEAKKHEIQQIIRLGPHFHSCHIIVHNCCMETWFLGNAKMLRRHPYSIRLRELISFHDVSSQDPEQMGTPPEHEIRAQFHEEYLKEMFREQGLIYNKSRPAVVTKSHYLTALVNRNMQTNHLQTFGDLIKLWRAFGGAI